MTQIEVLPFNPPVVVFRSFSLTDASMNPFAHHVPGPFAKEQMKVFREQFFHLWQLVNFLPASREKSLALTNLEIAAMWANKAAVAADPQSEREFS